MPLVAHNDLPTFQRLSDEGYAILPEGRALTQDIRELHIGFLNMMPCSALQATERQFYRLIGNSNQVTQIYMHPFSLPGIQRSDESAAYIAEHYETFEQIKEHGLDALIITGANVISPELSHNDFFEPLEEVLTWAWENLSSTICSCLTTHAIMELNHDQKRARRAHKLWGVYKHRVRDRAHPLIRNINTIFDVPHSRWNTIEAAQFEESGLHVLVSSEEAGVHMATSEDGFRMICFQGHPEYDTVSLLKEYKREVDLFIQDKRKDYPPFPEYYFSDEVQQKLEAYKSAILAGNIDAVPPEIGTDDLENTWRDSAKTVIGNWIGSVYQVTNMDCKKQFMDGINPNDPLGIKSK